MVEWIAKRWLVLYYLFLLGLSFNMLTTATWGKGLHSLVLTAISYPLKLSREIYNSGADIIAKIKKFEEIARENQKLKETIAQLREENSRLKASLSEIKKMLPALKEVEKFPARRVMCQVTGETRSGAVLFIHCGRREGLYTGAPVIGPKGVVGRVLDVGETTSSVATLLNPQLALDAVTLDSGVRGIVEGGRGRIYMTHIKPTANVQPGEQVVTSGRDSVFPYGIPIGKILKVKLHPTTLAKEALLESPGAEDIPNLTTVVVLVQGR